ncbi:hypothetical protein Cgig2_012409 [Carnegiea gigantea]|uniref:EF-hand domain-containing protein n=1 Tax=Carnegiea gigantea TaxID=171969 RepID=A0A9Q1KML5_9CARY|nr:hypothetical protein Cgig2_012409 [Carnegiea gigantea]
MKKFERLFLGSDHSCSAAGGKISIWVMLHRCSLNTILKKFKATAINYQEIVSLYERFCQLDRNAKGFISTDEFMSVPEFAMNPLAQRLLKMVDGLNFKDFVAFLSAFIIFGVYDSDGNGKVTFNDILEVLRDMTGSFMSDKQREEVLAQLLLEAGYTRESYLLLDDFVKIFANSGLKMDVEVPVD